MKKRVYLGKWYLLSIVIFILAFPPVVYFLGVLSDLFSFGEAGSVEIRNIVLISAFPVIVLFIIWHRQLVLFYVFDDEGMQASVFKRVVSSIKWEEISVVGLAPVKFDARWNGYVSGMANQTYLVFSTDRIRDDYEHNAKKNFCIWRPVNRIYAAILPHLDKLLEEHQEEVRKFFEKKGE